MDIDDYLDSESDSERQVSFTIEFAEMFKDLEATLLKKHGFTSEDVSMIMFYGIRDRLDESSVATIMFSALDELDVDEMQTKVKDSYNKSTNVDGEDDGEDNPIFDGFFGLN